MKLEELKNLFPGDWKPSRLIPEVYWLDLVDKEIYHYSSTEPAVFDCYDNTDMKNCLKLASQEKALCWYNRNIKYSNFK